MRCSCVALVAIQAARSEQTQDALRVALNTLQSGTARIERNTEQPPRASVNIPPAQVVVTPQQVGVTRPEFRALLKRLDQAKTDSSSSSAPKEQRYLPESSRTMDAARWQGLSAPPVSAEIIVAGSSLSDPGILATRAALEIAGFRSTYREVKGNFRGIQLYF